MGLSPSRLPPCLVACPQPAPRHPGALSAWPHKDALLHGGPAAANRPPSLPARALLLFQAAFPAAWSVHGPSHHGDLLKPGLVMGRAAEGGSEPLSGFNASLCPCEGVLTWGKNDANKWDLPHQGKRAPSLRRCLPALCPIVLRLEARGQKGINSRSWG